MQNHRLLYLTPCSPVQRLWHSWQMRPSVHLEWTLPTEAISDLDQGTSRASSVGLSPSMTEISDKSTSTFAGMARDWDS